MIKEFLKEGGIYTVANLLTKGVSLLLIPFYTAYFTEADYGVLDIILIFSAIFNGVVSFQLNQSLGRFIGEQKTELKKTELASTIIIAVTLFYVFAASLCLFFSETLIDWMSSDTKVPKDLFQLAIVSISINGIFYLLGVYFRFIRKTKIYSLLSFAHAIGNIILTIVFVLAFDTGIYGVIYASLIVAPIIVIVQLYFARKNLAFVLQIRILKKAFKYSAPLVPAVLLYQSLNFIDRLFIKEMIDFSNLGIYAVATKFTTGLEIVVMGFGMALNPIIYERLDKSDTKEKLAKLFHYYVLISAFVLLILMLFSEEIIYLFTDPKFHAASSVLPVLFLAPILQGINKFSIGINISKKTKWIPFITLISALLNIGLNYVLIPSYGIIGAAISTTFSILVNNLILSSIGFRLFPIPFQRRKVLWVLISFITLISIFYLCNLYIEIEWIRVTLKLSLITGFYLLIQLIALETFNFNLLLDRFRKKIR